jgi:hypothetical protein
MPTIISQEQLMINMAAASKDADSFRHQGPQGQGGDHRPDLGHGLGAGTSWAGQPQVLNPQGLGGGGGQEDTQYFFTQDNSVPVFQKECSKCPWRSIASTDPGAYTGAVADLELHIK